MRLALSTAARSIPARAGEPPGMCGWMLQAGVYPRACGGTHDRRMVAILEAGLSPRVRGNQKQVLYCMGVLWSIPARAGEPNPYRQSGP